jgi:hypothetical protein
MISRQQLSELKSARPFRPFLLRLGDGRIIAVDRPESFACDPAGTQMHVFAGGESISFIDMATAEVFEAPNPLERNQ